MTSLVRPRTFLVPFAFAFLGVLLLLVGVAHAATGAASGGSDLPDVGASAARWYSDGRLAGPVVLAVFGLLPPIAGAVAQEAIDVLAILNASRVAMTRKPMSDFRA